MGIKNRIQGGAPSVSPEEKLYREERAYRADRLREKWGRVPELGEGMDRLDESAARNLAILLENQARALSRMTETQLSTNFNGFTPENMLRLVRLAYPNSIRGQLFTEFAMETARDSIKYIRPVYTDNTGSEFPLGGGTAGDSNMENRFFGAPGDLFTGSNEFTAADYRKAMYESTTDRYGTELANATVAGGAGTDDGAVDVTFVSGAFGTAGANYIDGYSAIFLGEERKPLAIQMKDGSWFSGQPVVGTDGVWYRVEAGSATAISGGFTFVVQSSATETGTYTDITDAAFTALQATDNAIRGYGRFDSEGDINGEYLGEVELIMTDYQFRPRAHSLGVTWTKLTELVLDTSFGISAEEMLLDSAGQEIKKQLDFRAVRLAYRHQRQQAAGNFVAFDAEAGAGTDDSYIHTAQTISQPIERIGDLQYDDILRGGVSRIVGGPAAVTYLRLNSGFTTRGAQERIGGYQVGEIYGIPVFKVPSNVIPSNELMTVWKNTQNEADVALAIGTLLPFYSTGAIVRKNFFSEAGVARYEDSQVLQPRYLGRIRIDNIRQG